MHIYFKSPNRSKSDNSLVYLTQKQSAHEQGAHFEKITKTQQNSAKSCENELLNEIRITPLVFCLHPSLPV